MLGSKKKQSKVNRSRSRSLSPQRSSNKLNKKGSKKLAPKTSRGNNNRRSPVNPSLVKSQSKKGLNKSVSQSKLNRSSSQPRIGSGNISYKKVDIKGGPRSRERSQSKDKVKGHAKVQVKGSQKEVIKPVQELGGGGMKSEERQMGLIFVRPQHDKIMFKSLEITDPVFDKYLQMINNDNDANYLLNALPELRSFKKEDESEGRDFVSGRISRLSGIFQSLSVDKILSAAKKVPQYYAGQCGKNLSLLRIVLQTRFKVEVDVGFLQYSLDGDKLTIFRLYVSKIYRRMNYLGYIYMQSMRGLMAKHPGADRWAIFVLDKNVPVHKFFKYLGFHIEKIATEGNKRSMDYFQEFTIKKKDLHTVLSNMAK